MAGENTAIGSALVIPDSLFARLDKMDEKLKVIQQSSEKTASVMTTAFSSMQGGTMSLEGAFNRLIDVISKVNTSAASASAATSNLGAGFASAASNTNGLGASITGVTNSLNALIAYLSETGSIGKASFMQAMTAAKQLQEAMKFRDSNLIPELKAMIESINKELKDKDKELTKARQDALIERKRQLQEELKEAERTNAERAINVQKTEEKIIAILAKSYEEQKKQNEGKLKSLDDQARKVQEYQLRMMELQNQRAANAQKAYEQEVKAETEKQKAIERTAAAQQKFEEQQRVNKQAQMNSVFSASNVTPKGAMLEAQLATTIEEKASAVKMLEAAQSRLNTSEASGREQLNSIVAKIRELKSEIASMSNYGISTNSATDKLNQLFASKQNVIKEWQDINRQLDELNKKQLQLNQVTTSYQQTLNKINSGGSGAITNEQTARYNNALQEYNANQQIIASLKQRRQELNATNSELANQIAHIRQLQSIPWQNEQYKEQMRQMSEYYKQLEKSSAEAQKNYEREQASMARKRAELERLAKAQEQFNSKQRQEKQNSYSSVFSVDNVTAKGALTEAKYASTIQERTQAIRLLESARARLNTTDENGRATLDDLNKQIKRLNAENRKAVEGSKELQQQHSRMLDTVGQLKRAFTLLFSVSQIKQFVISVAQTRGYFELQQRSLQAIIQNRTKADEIFKLSLAQALDSRFTARELITYTKQLAAYRIETDKLFDTTKRLADVSAGLGVDMQRLILAYGQVKAAAYLRGTEVRQFTEAGVNLYGELQSYFKEVKGEAYTTAQIVDMISKRKVTFEDIEQVFKRLTNEGGIFYNMQHIQVQTLDGKLQKFQDTLEQMKNNLGVTYEGLFKGVVDSATSLVRSWEALTSVGLRLIEVLALMKMTAIGSKMSLGTMIMQNANITKIAAGAKGMERFTLSMKNFGSVVASTGRIAKASLASFLPLLIAVEAISAGFRVYLLSQQKTEKNKSQLDEYSNETAKITQLAQSYKKLADARNVALNNKSNGTEGNFDFIANFNEKKSELKTIQDELDKVGLKLSIDIESVTQDNIDDVARVAINKLQKATDIALQAQKIVNDDNYSFWKNEWIGQPFVGETIAQNIIDYEKAANDVMNYSTDVRTSLNLLGKSYDSLSDSSKKLFDSVKDGAKDGENQFEYVKRSYNALRLIQKDIVQTTGRFNTEFTEQFRTYSNRLSGQIMGFWQANDQEETLKKTLREQIERIYLSNKDYWDSLKPFELRAQWNQTAINSGYSGITKDLYNKIAAEMFKFTLTPDTKETEKQLDWVTEYVKKYLAKQNFTVDINVNTSALQKWLDAGDELEKDANKVAEFLKRQKKRTYKGANGKDVLQVDDSIREFMGQPLQIGAEISWSSLSKRGEQLLKNQGKTLSDVFGIKLENKDKSSNKAAKQQRDILSEQIDLVTALLNKYKELRKYKSAEESVDVLKSYYASSIQYTKIGSDIIDRILENGEVSPEKVAAVVDNIAKKFKEVTKRNNALQKAADIRANVVVDTDKKSLDESKKDIEDAFNALSMYRDLKKLGLNDVEIRNTFGELPKTFKDIQNIITATFTGKEGEEWIKQREESEKKLAENVQKYNLDMFKELTKDYKTQLEDQLQLDVWYAEERTKIMKNVNDPNLRKQYIENLDTKYQEKTDKNIWDAFSSSDAYIDLFDNLEYYSNTVLVHMKERLVEIRQQLGKLNPTEIKQILDAEQKLDEQLNKSQSWGNLAKNLKSYIKLRKQVSRDKGAETQARKDLANYTKQLDIQSKIVAQKKVAADDSTDATSKAWSEYAAAVSLYETTKKNKEEAEDTVKTYDKQRKSLAEMTKTLLANIQNLGKIKLGDGMEESVSGLTNSLSEFASMLEDSFGVYIGQDVKDILEGVGAFFGAIENFDITKPISSALNLLTGLGKSIGAIFGFGNKDDDLQKEIQKHQVLIERLQRAYDKLKESMDKAWSSDLILQNRRDLEKNIELQIKNYQAMIKAENDKKHTDVAKIQEWQDAIEDLQDSIKELEEEITQAFGGIGEKNYKSAAEAFSDAWLDAFNNTENSLEALNDTFDDYFNTILKKQILNRAAQRYLQPLFDAIDKAVSEGSAGGNMGTDVTAGELQGIQDLANIQLEGFNEYVSALMEALNIKPSSQNSLSALQQGIQNITESQASAIESILNSMRFFAAQTAEDVSAIRRLLTASRSLVQSDGEQSLLLGELKNQTSIMNKLYSLLDSVIKPTGHRYNGGGIKVFMN